jgi:hypothetical protein
MSMGASSVGPPPIIAANATLDATLVVLGVAALVLAAHCALHAVRHRSLLPVLAIVGGVIALPIEPFWDVNVLFTFATNSHPVALTEFGRHIPTYLAFIYPAFIGWGSFLGYHLIRKGTTVRGLLALPICFFVADALIEIAGIRLRLWGYYGHQPLRIAQWPILFGALNGTIPLVGGALLAVLEGRLVGSRRPLLALAVPSAYIGTYAIAGWPMWAALNASVSPAVAWLAGAAAIAICVLAAQLVAQAMGATRGEADLPATGERSAAQTARARRVLVASRQPWGPSRAPAGRGR